MPGRRGTLGRPLSYVRCVFVDATGLGVARLLLVMGWGVIGSFSSADDGVAPNRVIPRPAFALLFLPATRCFLFG